VAAFATGESIALRNVWHGRIVSARPATVVRDEPSATMLYVPLGVRWWSPTRTDGSVVRIPTGAWSLRARRWDETHVLSFSWPGEPHAVLLFWDAGWRPRHWYVNLEDPLRRTEIGFDYRDLLLDAVVEPDRSRWEWKDEDELADAVRDGLVGADDTGRLRDEGERLVRRIVGLDRPFDRDWWDWRPDPAWAFPVLADGWDRPEHA
jgi:hypothetical protein